MPSIKQAKANLLETQAIWARENHHTHFTPIFNMPMFHIGFSGAVYDWGLMINSIEKAGWKLSMWAVSSDKQGRPQAMPVFVLASAQP